MRHPDLRLNSTFCRTVVGCKEGTGLGRLSQACPLCNRPFSKITGGGAVYTAQFVSSLPGQRRHEGHMRTGMKTRLHNIGQCAVRLGVNHAVSDFRGTLTPSWWKPCDTDSKLPQGS
jgi:hypothetical protein